MRIARVLFSPENVAFLLLIGFLNSQLGFWIVDWPKSDSKINSPLVTMNFLSFTS